MGAEGTWVSRAATPEDVPGLLELVHAAYRGGPDVAGWTTEAHLLDGLRADRQMVLDMISAPGSQIRLLLDGDEPLACCHVDVSGGDTGYFGFFAVRPGRQGGGIGSTILAEAERIAAEHGCHRMRMTVLSARSDLIAYYERRGYRRTGATEPFPYGDERFGTPKRPDLEFAELVKPLGTPAAR
ncbi:GNAT family N-acetyltransferase [Actinocatenispora rupis]|uniref:N-acetyltransferase n=1 Tax=Actinocatenispora rupis TaxID=519421 RepID=A0A8J3J3Z1_9ACTN|nr:GNAT family N-acetyltransferase [Actinocatenispora rupis]GID13763.1 N-acetyltransferase [Actinocatenispora rupis]